VVGDKRGKHALVRWSIEILTRLRIYWQFLQGSSDRFSLQSRIYHFACLATIALMIYVLIFSLVMGFRSAAFMTAGLFPFQIFLYYLSRFKDRTTLSLYLYCAVFYVFFAFSYRISSGITGSSLLSLCLVHFLSLAVAPKKQYIILTIANLLFVSALLLADYHNPAFVYQGYENRKQQFIDIASTYAVNVILFFISLAYIIGKYTKEKEKAEDWAMLLDDLHEEKAMLLSLISHDFHTPLNSMKRYLDVLRDSDLKPAERKVLETEVSKSVANTQNLLMNLLDLTKGHFGRHISVSHFNVNKELHDTMQVYRDIAGGKGIEIISLIPADLCIVSNPHLFAVIIRNLINNAVKFTNHNGRIVLSYVQRNEHHVFSVADDGPGIDPRDQIKIVQSWQDETRNALQSGGIGLVLSKKYTVALGGDLSFTSQQGEGTVFCVRLPVQHQ
jgi:two-component system sensor histidine kinase/response regulator